MGPVVDYDNIKSVKKRFTIFSFGVIPIYHVHFDRSIAWQSRSPRIEPAS